MSVVITTSPSQCQPMRLVLTLLSLAVLACASSTAVAIENHLEKFNKEVNDSLKTKINTLRNILLQLDFKQTDDVKKALIKMDEFNKASEAGVSVRLSNLSKGLKELIKQIHGRGTGRSSLSGTRGVSRSAATSTARKPVRRATGPLPRSSSQLRTRRSAAYYEDSEEDSDDLYYDSDADLERYEDEESLERSFYRYARDRGARRY